MSPEYSAPARHIGHVDKSIWQVRDFKPMEPNRLIVYRPDDDDPRLSEPQEPDAPPSEVLLFPDYTGNGWVPLWPSSDATDAYFSVDLLQRLVAWHDEFQDNYSYDGGWISDEAKRRWADESKALEDEVRREITGKASLTVHLWPLGQGKRRYAKE